MATPDVANRYVSLYNIGKAQEIIDTLYADDIVSIQPPAPSDERTHGIEEKCKKKPVLWRWLIAEKGYPASNIAMEGSLKLNQLQKPAAILCLRAGKPCLRKLVRHHLSASTKQVFDQVFR
jgi:hypothetical protein